jgi:hypothetical protein
MTEYPKFWMAVWVIDEDGNRIKPIGADRADLYKIRRELHIEVGDWIEAAAAVSEHASIEITIEKE